MLNKYAQNKTERFNCEQCDYQTSKKSSWNQHLATRKHMNATKCYINATNAIQKYAHDLSDITCSVCGKEYKHYSSLYRHKKICSEYAPVKTHNNELITMTKNEYELALENRELTSLVKKAETVMLTPCKLKKLSKLNPLNKN